MEHPEKFFLTTSERNSLKALHRANRDNRICDRIKAILLIDNGWSYEKVATALLPDVSTIRKYYKIYLEGGTEALLTLHYSGKSPLLNNDQLDNVKAYVKDSILSTATEVVHYIRTKSGSYRDQLSSLLTPNFRII